MAVTTRDGREMTHAPVGVWGAKVARSPHSGKRFEPVAALDPRVSSDYSATRVSAAMRISVNPDHPEPRKIAQAVEALRRGEVIAYPTDTVYGLGCDISDKRAIDRIYQMKPMGKDHLLSFLCPDLSDIARYAFVDDPAYRIMRRLAPGPYTFILNATREVPKVLLMKRKTVGIRVPKHPVAQALLKELGSPILSTSASVDGENLIDPEDIDNAFPKLALILDVEACGNKSSTIIDLTGPDPEVIRIGAGPVDVI